MATNIPPDPNMIPLHGQERLQSMRTGGAGGQPFFTSDLSVNEFLLVRESGFDPLGMVVGSSIYHIGIQLGNWAQNMELDVLTQAMYQARELAMSRMEAEATALGADGVIGVRLQATQREWGQHLAEFVAIGTAVRSHNGGQYRNMHNVPFTSDLSGQDFWTLLRTGYRPVGLVMGNCVYHIAHQSMGQWFNKVGQNVEMTNFTQGLYDARELAMERMQSEALSLGAQGIVATQIVEGDYGWASHVMEFFAVGTAVVPMATEQPVPQPAVTLLLNE